MEILMQSIRVIDYENNRLLARDAPEEFSEYIRTLITYLNDNASVREYKTRSVNTEVISSIKDIVEKKEDEAFFIEKSEAIANRLLLKEREVQRAISPMLINVQKGSLVQALLYDAETDKHTFLLAKVEHTDFFDDADFSVKSGFSKDMKKLWKSCVFAINDLNATEFRAKIYSNTAAKYWYDGFLELNELNSDEKNTDVAIRSIEAALKNHVKKESPKDYFILSNAVVAYFSNNAYFDFDALVASTFEEYVPQELCPETMQTFLENVRRLPEEQSFDSQFNTVSSKVISKTKKMYDVYPGIQLRITGQIYDVDNTIVAYSDDDGNQYLRIKLDNQDLFNTFRRETIEE